MFPDIALGIKSITECKRKYKHKIIWNLELSMIMFVFPPMNDD